MKNKSPAYKLGITQAALIRVKHIAENIIDFDKIDKSAKMDLIKLIKYVDNILKKTELTGGCK